MRGLKLVALLLMIPVSANAHKCWVEKVDRTEEGVRIQFSHTPPNLNIRRYEGRNERYSSLPNSEEGYEVYSTEDGTTSINPKEISIRYGDMASMSNSPHDTCSITVEEREGKTGVKLYSFFAPHMPLGYEIRSPFHEAFVVAE